MVKIRPGDNDKTYEAMTPESDIEGVLRRAINFFGSSRRERKSKSGSEESSSATYYDICGRVSAEGIEKLVVALRDVEALRDNGELKCRPHDPYDPHRTKPDGWTDLLV
jgi:hypothetical protein